MRLFTRTLTSSFLLGFACSVISGCNPTKPSEATAPAETEPRKEWLVVSTDPAKLEAAREKAKKLKALAFADFYKGLTKSSYLHTDILEMIASQRGNVVARLDRLAASGMAKNQGIGAALVLLRLKEPGGFTRVKEVLRSGTDEQKVRVLSSLGWIYASPASEEFQSYRQFLMNDLELVDLVMKQLDSSKSNVVNAAAQLAGTLKFPGLSDRILQILQKPNDLSRDRLVYWLSQGELTQEIFEFAMSQGERARISTDNDWSGSLYEAFARSKNKAWSEPAREILILKLTAAPEKKKGAYVGWRMAAVDTIAETATKDDLLRIRSLAKREQGYYATSLLAAWIRIDPKGGRKTLLQWLAKPDRRDVAIDAATKVYAKTGDQEIVAALKEISGDLSSRDLYSVCYALQSIGGDEASKILVPLIPRLESYQQAYFKRAMTVVPLEELLASVENSEVFPADVMSQVEAKIRQEPSALSPSNTSDEELEDREPSGLRDIFFAAKCGFGFDTETDEVPCHHDRLLLDFAKVSRGRFVPEAVSEEWLRKKKTDDQAPYRVLFIHQGRLYDGELQNLGDWYDVERLAAMINRAFQDAEIPERFVALEDEGQYATFVFADPSRLKPLAKKFQMPLSDDAGQATKQGRDFE